jgi:hypothetical protein
MKNSLYQPGVQDRPKHKIVLKALSKMVTYSLYHSALLLATPYSLYSALILAHMQ